MNRRSFVSRVVLGGAAVACTNFSGPADAAPSPGAFQMRFIGLMGFVERKDRSFLVATPGDSHHHATHVPFLMARKDSPLARAFGMAPAPGVVPAAFDNQLDGSNPADFVYRSLANTALEVVSGATNPVINRANQMAHLTEITAGKRLRGNLEKWATSTISLRGGTLDNSGAHPDAGKIWSFGDYRQRLTDAVNYSNLPGASTTLRLTSGSNVEEATVSGTEAAQLWMISTAAITSRMNDPMMLVHSELLFDFLVDATAVPARCAEATGREVPSTALPFVKPTNASLGLVAGEAAAPPFTDLCFICDILLGSDHQ